MRYVYKSLLLICIDSLVVMVIVVVLVAMVILVVLIVMVVLVVMAKFASPRPDNYELLDDLMVYSFDPRLLRLLCWWRIGATHLCICKVLFLESEQIHYITLLLWTIF